MLKSYEKDYKTGIKMCGITTLADVAAVNEVKPDYIGMVMYFSKSKRNVSPETAKLLLGELGDDIQKAAVVVSPEPEQIAEIAQLGFDIIQIHGQVADEVISQSPLPVWKAFNVKDMNTYPHYQSLANIAGYVFDAGEPGSGKTFDWASLAGIERDDRLFILAGGLTPENVGRAIAQVHPDVVDVSSGIEYDVTCGIQKTGKNPWKMRRFAAAAAGNPDYRGMVRSIIDQVYEYGQGRGDLPEVEALAEAIGELSQPQTDVPGTNAIDDLEYLRRKAYELAHESFGNRIYIRGLIEFTNICRNDCYYCGIRKSNGHVDRYRLSREEILSCAVEGYALGFRTFVLQGGEDGGFSDEDIADIVRCLKDRFPDCAVTLSFGEHSYDTYRLWREAGADRYLLRHETADKEHYQRLHPAEMSYDNRVRCLHDLKKLGYQVGSGFMVGSPYQTAQHLAKDLHFLAKLQPQMIGIGPYIPHKDTPFAAEKQGTVRQTLVMISLLRLMFPKALIPSTTSLGTIAGDGREQGFMHGANVVMPNLSPVSVRKKYELYDNKICTGEESAQCRGCLDRRAQAYGFQVVVDRGDYI